MVFNLGLSRDLRWIGDNEIIAFNAFFMFFLFFAPGWPGKPAPSDEQASTFSSIEDVSPL